MSDNLKFGDMIENGYAGDGNPNKRGYFVRTIRRTGKLNPGKFLLATNGRGKFWEIWWGEDHKITKIRDSPFTRDESA